MSVKALVVEDDACVVEAVADVLYSLDHEYVSANNLQDARSVLESEDFGYVLLDLEFPTKPIRGFARASKENGSLLLEDIQRVKGAGQLPVIIMSGHVAYCLNRSIEFRDKGASEFIAKPFPTEGRTLATVIRDVLAGRSVSDGKPQFTGSPRPFSGGELTLYSNRIEVSGVDIPLSKLMRQAFDELNATRPSGIYVAYTGEELADLINCQRGQNGVAEMIRDFRNRSTDRLLEMANVAAGRFDIIQSGGPGYRLNPQVKIRTVGHNGVTAGDIDRDVPVNTADDFSDPPANERQQWILNELKKGAEIRVTTVALRCKCSPATAKRELAQLRKRQLIRFEGPSKTGCYRLVERCLQAECRPR